MVCVDFGEFTALPQVHKVLSPSLVMSIETQYPVSEVLYIHIYRLAIKIRLKIKFLVNRIVVM